MNRSALFPACALAALALAAPAQAQTRGWLDNDRSYSAPEEQSFYDARRVAYDNGFQEGVKQGEKDGRKNKPFDYDDEKTFQHADKGYHREFGTVERYRQTFRTGYAAGYSEGYQRYAPSYGYGGYNEGRGRYGRGRAVPRDTYPETGSYPGYPQQQYPGSNGRYGNDRNAAVQNGFNDGVEKGSEDARKNRSFDPLRHEWYRAGDRHYDSRYGPRDQYKDFYREGFKAGYERGYRDGRYR